MQHNNWKRDRELLAEAYAGTDPELEDLARDAMAPDPMEDPTREVEDGETVGEESIVGRLEKLVERLEELSHTFDDTRESHEEWAQIITGIKESLLLL